MESPLAKARRVSPESARLHLAFGATQLPSLITICLGPWGAIACGPALVLSAFGIISIRPVHPMELGPSLPSNSSYRGPHPHSAQTFRATMSLAANEPR